VALRGRYISSELLFTSTQARSSHFKKSSLRQYMIYIIIFEHPRSGVDYI